jgi:hypothetical protein
MTNPQGDLVSGFTTVLYMVFLAGVFVGFWAGYWLHYWTAKQKQADAAAVLEPGDEQAQPRYLREAEDVARSAEQGKSSWFEGELN